MDLLENAENDYAPVYTVKPYTFSSSKEVNSLHFFESGEIIAEDIKGNKKEISADNQPKELREIFSQKGQKGLNQLLTNRHIYVRNADQNISIELLGGLKGGMMGNFLGGSKDLKSLHNPSHHSSGLRTGDPQKDPLGKLLEPPKSNNVIVKTTITAEDLPFLTGPTPIWPGDKR